MKLDKTVLDILSGPILVTWNEVGSDTEQCCQECGDRLTNAIAMETCLDANRLDSCGRSPEADKLVGELFAEHGYDKVFKFLCKNVRLE